VKYNKDIILSLVLSKENTLASSGIDHYVYKSNLNEITGDIIKITESFISDASFSPKDSSLLFTSNNNIYISEDLKTVTKEIKSEAPIFYMKYSQDGARAISSDEAGTVTIWNTADWSVSSKITSPFPVYIWPSFSPSGERFLLVKNYTLELYETSTHRLLWSFAGDPDPFTTAAFSSDGKIVVAIARTRKLFVFDADSGKVKQEIPTEACLITAVSHSKVASGGCSTKIFVHSLDGHSLRPTPTELKGNSSDTNQLEFSQDGDFLLSASDGGSASVWDLSSAGAVRFLSSQGGDAVGITASPDNSKIALVSDNPLMLVYSNNLPHGASIASWLNVQKTPTP
jgi:WD40 repeat protein